MNQLIKDCHEKIKFNSENLDSFLRNIKTNNRVFVFDLGTEPTTNWSLKTVIPASLTTAWTTIPADLRDQQQRAMDYINQVRQGLWDVIPLPLLSTSGGGHELD